MQISYAHTLDSRAVGYCGCHCAGLVTCVSRRWTL